MCGIFGVVGTSASWRPDEQRLRQSVRLLAHRGPDGEGVHVGEGVGFAHTRLALVDPSERSNQPLWDSSGRYCLVYNGEIYNHRELRAELACAGVEFRTTGDTEVLLHCLVRWGWRRTLRRIEGMFAFAFHDVAERSVVLARDRFGMKPLYVHYAGEELVFSSEIRAMRPWVPLRADPHSISAYLQGFGGPTSGHTFYDRIRFLPPGSVLQTSVGGRPEATSVLTLDELLDDEQAAELARRSPAQLADEVEHILARSVDRQLLADAPVGALCSGGVDSALLLALASRRHTNLAIFHANVVGVDSELGAARLLARHLGLDLRVVDVHDDDVVEQIPHVIAHAGHPFVTTPHSVPFLMVSTLVRDHGVKAVLSGEGADECFLGYPWQCAPAPSARRALARLVGRLAGPAAGQPGRPGQASAAWPSANVVVDLHNRFETVPERALGSVEAGRVGADPRLLTVDALGYNLRALLHRNDAMGMAASVEARFPFLDGAFVRLATNIPVSMKLRRNRMSTATVNKWILRTVAARHLPPELSNRPKAPFTFDVFKRMRIDGGLFRDGHVAAYYDLSDRQVEHLVHASPPALQVKLMQLEAWMRLCLAGDDAADVSSRLRESVAVVPDGLSSGRGRPGRTGRRVDTSRGRGDPGTTSTHARRSSRGDAARGRREHERDGGGAPAATAR